MGVPEWTVSCISIQATHRTLTRSVLPIAMLLEVLRLCTAFEMLSCFLAAGRP